MNYIIEDLQIKAERYTSNVAVQKRKSQSDWYVDISMPGIGDNAYEEVTKNIVLLFIGDAQSDNPEIIVTNQNIKSASATVWDGMNGEKEYVIGVSFDDEGTRAFAEGTEKYLGSSIAIVLDGVMINAPVVQTVITTGEAYVSYFGSSEEAERVAALLRAGYLEFRLEEISEIDN